MDIERIIERIDDEYMEEDRAGQYELVMPSRSPSDLIMEARQRASISVV